MTKIYLKRRSGSDEIRVPVNVIQHFVRQEDKDGLMNYFQGVAEEDFSIHDKAWLETIINWVPEGGSPLTEAAKWFKLAERVAELDEDREGEFTLSPFQIDIIWQRLRNPNFKVQRLSKPFMEFLIHFQEATGKHFPDEDPGNDASD